MTEIALGIAVKTEGVIKAAGDLSSLEKAAGKTEKAVSDVGEAAGRAGKALSGAKPATKQMEEALSAFSGANDNAVGAINRHIAAIAKLTEAERRMSSSFSKGADIAAYGQELDRLRAKYNPLFATIQQYKTEQEEIRRAHAVGAISTDEMSAALSRERQAALSSIAALKGHRTAVSNSVQVTQKLAAVNEVAAHNTGNLAAQFQDIAVTSAMGMSPLQVALQQGTQISAVLGPMGAGGAIRSLGAAFLSVISPVSLATIVLVAAGAAAIQYFFSVDEGSDKVDTQLRKQADLIRAVADRWGEAVPMIKAYADELDRVSEIADARTAGEVVAKAQFDGLGEQLKGIRQQYSAANEAMRGIGADPAFLRDFKDAFANINVRINEGKATVADFMQVQNAMAAAVERYGVPAVLEFKDAFDKISVSIEDSIKAAKRANSEWIKALVGADNVQDILSTMFTDNGKSRRASDFMPANPPTPQARPKIELEGLPGSEKQEKQVQKLTDSYKDLILNANQRIDQMRLELDIAGKSGAAAEALRFEQDLLAQAMEKAGKITPDQRREIHSLAEEYGRLSQAIEEATSSANLMFEREQMGRSKTEQRVASELRRIYGSDYQSYMDGAIAGQVRLNERMKEAQDELREVGDIGKDALGGLVDILYEGGDAAENLLSLFAGIGRQFARMGMDKLMKSITGQSGGLDLSGLSGLGNVTPHGGSATAAAGREIGAAVAPVIKSSLTVGNNDIAGNIQKAAQTLGISARDLATVISYETGGTFSTSIRGGAGNRHIGLIQFGPAEQKKYGAAIGQTMADQMDAVVGYLQDRGLKPGMGLLDLYSTINAGRPGLYNRSDAANGGAWGTVADKVNRQMSGHQATADRVLGRQAVKDGMIDANRKLQQDAHVQAWRVQEGGGGATSAQMSKMEAALGVGGAAFGAFAGGYQSGSPLMGGLSGAMAGAGATSALSALGLGAAAGPVGIIGGAILGVVGGILGKRSQKKKEQNQAKQQLDQNRSALEELFARGEGRGIGATTQAYNDFYGQTAQLDEIAQKAGDDGLVKKLRDNVNSFFIILEKDYIGKFQGLVDAYSSGLGSNSPFVQGVSAMEQLREELKGFVADAQSFGELQLKNKRDLTPEQLEQRVKAAQEAAQKMALAALAGVEPLSQMEEELLRVKGASATLQTTLEQLGMSAEQAAASIETATTTALNKLRDGFMKDITSSMNELSGVGYINDIMDAQVAYQARLKDSAALGIDSSFALRELSLSLKEIVQSAGLTKDEIGLLSQTFPELQFALKGWSQDTMTLAEATSQLQAAYESEASALEDAISKNKAWIASIKQFREAMKISDSSPLSPNEKVEEAAKQFRELAAKAMGGDEDALGQLMSISQDYLDEAQAYYTSSVKYFEIWKEVDATLDKVQKASEGNLSESQRQLDALKASVNGILKIDESVLSVKDALAQYNAALTANLDTLKTQLGMVGTNAINQAYHTALGRDPEAGGLAYWQNRLNTGSSVSDVTSGITGSREAEVNKLYNDIFGRNVDTASAQFWVNSSKSIAEIEADLKYAKSMGAYANGGFHDGGLRLVGERGPEIEATGPSRIWSASQTRAMLQPTGGNGDLVSELKALREEVAALRTEQRRQTDAVAYAGNQQISEQQKTNANLANISSDLKLANAR